MLYEDPTKDITSDERYHVELHFSPGVNCCVQKELPPGPGFRPQSRSKGSSTYNPAAADMDLVEPTTPPPPLVCSIKCSKDSFGKVFGKQPPNTSPAAPYADFVFDEDQACALGPLENVQEEVILEADLEHETLATSAVSEPIGIQIDTVEHFDEEGGKVR